jgi:hypothetical protein
LFIGSFPFVLSEILLFSAAPTTSGLVGGVCASSTQRSCSSANASHGASRTNTEIVFVIIVIVIIISTTVTSIV